MKISLIAFSTASRQFRQDSIESSREGIFMQRIAVPSVQNSSRTNLADASSAQIMKSISLMLGMTPIQRLLWPFMRSSFSSSTWAMPESTCLFSEASSFVAALLRETLWIPSAVKICLRNISIIMEMLVSWPSTHKTFLIFGMSPPFVRFLKYISTDFTIYSFK